MKTRQCARVLLWNKPGCVYCQFQPFYCSKPRSFRCVVIVDDIGGVNDLVLMCDRKLRCRCSCMRKVSKGETLLQSMSAAGSRRFHTNDSGGSIGSASVDLFWNKPRPKRLLRGVSVHPPSPAREFPNGRYVSRPHSASAVGRRKPSCKPRQTHSSCAFLFGVQILSPSW